ncbi:MAG: outer membrane lipoprotein carrier protein LolA [Bacteroidales bacterium]|nr:outer membrane lipoprotein carrier protein LolA [Bacteroidales bacterium]
MRKLLCIISLSLASLFSGMAQNQSRIIEQINSAGAAVKSLECDFTQTKHIKLLNDKMVSTGKLYYAQSGSLRWEYVSPYSYIFILSDSKVLLKNSDRSDVIDVNQNKMFRSIAKMMGDCIVGKCLSDASSFQTSISESPSEWVATLVPLKKDLKQMWSKLVLHFDPAAKCVKVVEMYETTGDKTIIEMKNIKMNKAIDPKVFSVQ